jgi:hypothetical protein
MNTHPIQTANRSESQALLTVEAVAILLSVSPEWVRDHATRKQPRLPVIRVGKLLRFRPHEIERWIQEQT